MQVSQEEENSEIVSGIRETSGGEEIRRKWTRFRYFAVRIAHRWSRASDLPHDSFFSSDESFHSHVRTSALTRVSIIDPSAAKGNIYSVAWLQSQHTTTRSRRLSFFSQGIERKQSPFRERVLKIIFLLFPRRTETSPSQFRAIGNSQLTYANIIGLRSANVNINRSEKEHFFQVYYCLKLLCALLIVKITRLIVFIVDSSLSHLHFFKHIYLKSVLRNYFFIDINIGEKMNFQS